MVLNMGKSQEDHVDPRFRDYKKISSDLKHLSIVTEPRGYNGWLVHLCYTNNKCADFQVDSGLGKPIEQRCDEAIIKQLEWHEANKD